MSDYKETLMERLKLSVDSPKIGDIYQDTTQGLGVRINELLVRMTGITELNNIIISPTMAKTDAGASSMHCVAYFDTTGGGNGNIFYRGKKDNRSAGGKINMVSTAGVASAGSGPFGTSANFDKAFKPLCPIGKNGERLMVIKHVDRGLASLELDFDEVAKTAFGISSNDPYVYSFLYVAPIPNTNNFSITFAKMISNQGGMQRNTKFNYDRIEQEQFKRYNNGGGRNNNNGGGRRY